MTDTHVSSLIWPDWLFSLTFSLPHHYQLCLSIWTVVWTGSALLLHRCCGAANFVGRIMLLPALLWVWTPSSPSLPSLQPETYQICFIRTWSLLTDSSHRSSFQIESGLSRKGTVPQCSAWITRFSFTHFIHILILTDTFISWIVLYWVILYN